VEYLEYLVTHLHQTGEEMIILIELEYGD
jgi:hypothetical protein